MIKEEICAWIIIDNLGRILLVKRKYNLKSLPNYWGIPGWHIENWETLEEAVIREVKEEVWLNFLDLKLFETSESINKENSKIKVIHRFLGNVSWDIIVQENECDWFAWYNYTELDLLLINSNLRVTIDKLKVNNIIK